MSNEEHQETATCGGQPPGASPEAKVSLLRDRLDREHGLLNDRTNVFLVFHSILMAGLAISGPAPAALFVIVPILGIVASTIWWYVGYRNQKWEAYFLAKVIEAETELPETDQVISAFAKERDKTRSSLAPSSSTIFGQVFPVLWLLVWLAVLLVGAIWGLGGTSQQPAAPAQGYR